MISNDIDPKKPLIFSCNLCLFSSCNKKDYNRHNETKKHIFNISQCFSTEKTPKNLYGCDCGKTYKDSSGLWRHKKKCTCKQKEELYNEDTGKTNEIQEMKEFMKYLMKENSDMKNMILEQQNIMMAQNTSTQTMMMKVLENGTHNTTTHTNSHNKAFNLNFFLNETCKDAMNITDFVESIKLQLSDL